ncbi:unnamed protein product [Protopolystoma xenopodis]|uniref:Uncharacterized protein n=1 Tax=Protopolystoma xenopodis TaxID=117903 RepID=A0A3S5BCD2_9PLAT|nr:unnamed protein product [Protopolystoma xenopodis]
MSTNRLPLGAQMKGDFKVGTAFPSCLFETDAHSLLHLFTCFHVHARRGAHFNASSTFHFSGSARNAEMVSTCLDGLFALTLSSGRCLHSAAFRLLHCFLDTSSSPATATAKHPRALAGPIDSVSSRASLASDDEAVVELRTSLFEGLDQALQVSVQPSLQVSALCLRSPAPDTDPDDLCFEPIRSGLPGTEEHIAFGLLSTLNQGVVHKPKIVI